MVQSRAVEQAAAVVARVVPQEKISRTHVPLINGGIRTDKSPGDLAENEAVSQKALHIVAGRLVVDNGYIPFAATFSGVAQAVYEAQFSDGTTTLLLITTTSVYTYAPTVDQWQYTSLNELHYTTASYAAGATAIALDTVTDLVVGHSIGVMLDNGVQWQTVVDGIAALVVTLHDAIPVGRTVANHAIVVGAPFMAGNVTLSQVSIKIFPGNEWIVFSNGITAILYYYQGLVKGLPGLPANTTCAAIEVFHDCLILGGMTENGTHLPHRVRQSDAGDPTNWTTGIAAVYDLLESEDFILALHQLGPWLIVYREQSITRATYLGIVNEILFFETMVQQDGAQSQGAVVDVGGEHVFVGRNGIYTYNGGYALDSIGDGVFANFLAAQGDLYTPSKYTMFCVHVPDLDEVWVFYPSSVVAVQPLYPNKMLRVQLENNAWAERVFASSFVAAGFYTQFAFITWAMAPGHWNASTWARPWESRTLTKNVPNIMLCDASAKQVVVYDFAAETDNGAPIPWSLTTKQFGGGVEYTRWERASVVAVGGPTLIEMSQDAGQTWSAVGTYTFGTGGLTPQPAVTNVYIDRVSTRLQLRLSGTDPDFELRYFDLVHEVESEW